MNKFKKKPVIVEAITFSELVQHGIDNGGNIVNGMPWSFEYKGQGITHENDQTYLIPTLEGIMKFTTDDMLITGVNGEIYPCKKDIFEKTYEAIDTCNVICQTPLKTKNLTFGEALELLKKGYRVTRAVWNGEGQFVYYSASATSSIVDIGFDNELVPCRAHFALKTDFNDAVTWVPSIFDHLANDWVWLNETAAK